MNLLISYIFLGLIYDKFDKIFSDLNKQKLLKYIFYLLVIFSIFLLFINPASSSNSFDCKTDIHDYKVNNVDMNSSKVLIKSVSIFPEISNFNCFGKVSEISETDELKIYVVVTSKLFLNSFNIIFGVLFGLNIFYSNSRKFQIIICTLYLAIDYFINIYFFQIQINYFYLLIKILLIFLLKFVIFDKKLLKTKYEFLIIFTIAFIYINPVNLNIHPDSLYYLGYAVRGNTPYSAFFGNEHLFLYSLLVNGLYSIVGIYAVPILKILLCIWLAILVIKFSDLYEIKSYFRYSLIILLLTFQSFAGGDQFWGSFVPKNFGYLFSITGIYFLLGKKYIFASFMFSLSAYFQLAAFVVWLPFIGILYLKNTNVKTIFKTSVLVVFFTSPLLYTLLVNNYINITEQKIKISSLDYIITKYMRNHVYPFVFEDNKFKNINSDWNDDFLNIGLFFLLLLIISFLFRFEKNTQLLMVQISAGILLTYLILNFIFPVNSFILLQPYKIITLIALLLNLFLTSEINKRNFKSGFVLFIILISLFGFNNRIYDFSSNNIKDQNFNSSIVLQNMIIDTNTSVVVLPLYDNGSVQSELLDLEIKLGIDSYVSFKYFPQTIKDTAQWIERIDLIKRFYDGECQVLSFLDDFIFIYDQDTHPCGEFLSKENSNNIFKFNY